MKRAAIIIVAFVISNVVRIKNALKHYYLSEDVPDEVEGDIYFVIVVFGGVITIGYFGTLFVVAWVRDGLRRMNGAY